MPRQQSSSHRRCRWSSASSLFRCDHARRPVDALCIGQHSATVPSQWRHQGPGTVCLRQSGPRRPCRRFVMNWRHSFSARVTMDININSFFTALFSVHQTHILTMYSALQRSRDSATLIFSLIIIIITAAADSHNAAAVQLPIRYIGQLNILIIVPWIQLNWTSGAACSHTTAPISCSIGCHPIAHSR